MKKGILVLLIGMIVFAGCGKKPPFPKDSNTTEGVKDTNITIEQNTSISTLEDDIFECNQNDEVFREGIASKIVVVKSKRIAVLFDTDGNMLSRHRISLGEHPVGPKREAGDKKTPEGVYHIVDIRRDPKYYKEILISYPNREDIEASRALGVNPGGGITFHSQVPWNWDGHGDDYTLSHDWTIGCMAMTNKGMDNVWDSVNKDTIVEIRE